MATEAALAARNERSGNRLRAALSQVLEEGGAAGEDLLERLKTAELPHRDPAWQASERNEILAEIAEFIAYVLPDMRAVSLPPGEVPEGARDEEEGPALTDHQAYVLTTAGFGEDRLVRHATDEELLAIDGIGPEMLENIRAVTGPYEPALGDLTALELSEDLVQMLTGAGYETADSVMQATDEELLKIKGVGSKKLEEIRAFFDPERTRDTPDGPEAVSAS